VEARIDLVPGDSPEKVAEFLRWIRRGDTERKREPFTRYMIAMAGWAGF
jgi:hypothetical protein